MPIFWRRPVVAAAAPTDEDYDDPIEAPRPEMIAVIASAARIPMAGLRYNRSLNDAEWQHEAWAFYDTVPEFRYVCDWKSQAASRVRLFIAVVDENGMPADNPAESVPFATTFLGGPVVQAQLLAAMVLHLEVVGQCFLVGRAVDDGERWDVYSIEDLTDNGDGTFSVDDGISQIEILDPATTAIIKIWRPHPRKHAEANAPARAARAPLREIIRADQSLAAQIDSRLTGAGILLLPRELSFTVSGAQQDDGPGEDNGADEFMQTLTDAMMTAIENPNSVEAVVPIIARGPADQLDKVRLLTLSTPVSEAVSKTREEAVGRLARGLDVAAEVLIGMGNTNHLSGWQIEESNAKVHLANPVELICAALTEQYLWPSIRGVIQDYRRYVVWYSLSELVQRPDRAADAQQVYDRGELSGEALRRENGFTDADAPSDAERRRHDLLEVAGKVPVAAPAVVAELLRQMGVNVSLAQQPSVGPGAAPALAATPSGPGSQGKVITRSAPQESRPLPPSATGQAQTASALLPAAEALCLRALETAGKRLVGRSRFKFEHLPAWEYHTVPGLSITPTSATRLLDGAFGTCPTVAAAAQVPGDALTAVLYDYCTELLCSATAHDLARLQKALTAAELT